MPKKCTSVNKSLLSIQFKFCTTYNFPWFFLFLLLFSSFSRFNNNVYYVYHCILQLTKVGFKMTDIWPFQQNPRYIPITKMASKIQDGRQYLKFFRCVISLTPTRLKFKIWQQPDPNWLKYGNFNCFWRTDIPTNQQTNQPTNQQSDL